MKRIFALIASLIAFTCFTGFSMQRTVPDKTLEWVVEDYLDWNRYLGGVYTDYNYVITHDPDKATNTDTVQIHLSITYPHVTAASVYSATYQYDKSSDLWDVLRGGHWGSTDILTYDLTSSSRIWMDCIRAEGWTAEFIGEGHDDAIEFLPIDDLFLESFEPEDFIIDLKTGWGIDAYCEYDNGEEAIMQVVVFEFNQDTIAQALIDAMVDDTFDYLTTFDQRSGNNYSAILLEPPYDPNSYGTENILLIRQDATTFVVYSYYDSMFNGGSTFNYIMQQIGYVDFMTAG